MSSMDQMLVTMAERLLTQAFGDKLPEMLQRIQSTIDAINNFDTRLANIEQAQQLILTMVTAQANGGPSIGERMFTGAGIIQDIGPEIPPTLLLGNGTDG